MKNLIRTGIAALLSALLFGCTDLSGIDGRIDSLDSRVSALEKAVDAINSNINALKALAGNQTINKVEQDGDTYTITLGNGRIISLFQGTIGTANTPVLSIDADGYWMVDYGAGPEPVLQNGAKVSALGTDGVTPQFGVDESNYWIVSYDGGTTWKNVVYSTGEHAGQKVKAYDAGSGDSYFHNVEYDAENGVFLLTMKSGQTFSIPVVSDFLCSIDGADDVQKFAYAQTRTFSVTMKGVANYTIIAPEGWNASLQGEGTAILVVTAPEERTKSVYADSEADVSIIAFTKSGLSAAAKLQVALNGKTFEQRPYTSPSQLSVGTNDVQVRVLVENADEWYYLLNTTGEEPHAVEIIADGSKGSDNIFTISGLKQQTTYYLYTVAVKGTVMGVVSCVSFKTGMTDDRYQAYMDGEDVEVSNEHFSFAMNGSPKLLVATQENDTQLNSAISAGGVFFLETPEGTSFVLSETKINAQAVVIGRYASSRAKVVQSSSGRLRAGASLAMAYIDYNTIARNTASDRTVILTANEPDLRIAYMLFDSCTITIGAGCRFLVAGLSGSSEANVDTFRMTGCDIKITDVPATITSMHFYNTNAWSAIARIKEITYRNNIFYSPGSVRLHLHFPSQNWTAGTEYEVSENTEVNIANNTFYSAGSDWYMARVYRCGKITVKRNLCWQYSGSSMTAFNFVDAYGQGSTAPEYEVENNYSYGARFRAVGSTSITKFPADNVLSASLTNPLPNADPENWNFTPLAGFEKYGAQR